ncbi:hypothetical protein GUITHDRAFT_101358 [Guillardia theta CCMP2712]|uniref:Uncharacterized protein n=1 Tax=Guillardia theta (strain CCMP2712) TaxID=905079 RepID=L1JXU2_GUITC|nr:hypothetical protein GUITHDRAFT_101358 [Guillardia theta CCMP2712]EKX52908.1 hypothetical protein GUITHDRAFT_101358 [Guillardia theta CCMP2712]|eukprot:XP_005839888.1 hypothetical protein GUITHDRAFT_101358 [Guillardia theta CCMP2712]
MPQSNKDAVVTPEEDDEVTYVKTERCDEDEDKNHLGSKRKRKEDTPIKKRLQSDLMEEPARTARAARRLNVDEDKEDDEDGEEEEKDTGRESGVRLESDSSEVNHDDEGSDDEGVARDGDDDLDGEGHEHFHDTQSTTHEHESWSQSGEFSPSDDSQEGDESAHEASQQSSNVEQQEVEHTEQDELAQKIKSDAPLGIEVKLPKDESVDEERFVSLEDDLKSVRKENDELKRREVELMASVKDLSRRNEELLEIVESAKQVLSSILPSSCGEPSYGGETFEGHTI